MSRAQHGEAAAAPPGVPAGTRVYAVGDIHGRFDLLGFLLRRIEADLADAPARRVVVFLGDYVDRGPQSADVLDRLCRPLPGGAEGVFLKGNHEDLMAGFLAGDGDAGAAWLANGGAATLESYGIDAPPIFASPVALDGLAARLRRAMAPAHRRFLDGLALSYALGDYLFVHAGVRPGRPLGEQDPRDLMWIRGPFLDSSADFGAVVVHGHSVSAEPEVKPNRIGIDTGAYRSGRLTCLVLEGTTRRFLNPGQGKPG
jgi:serine/threonine protein phosphatase 1